MSLTIEIKLNGKLIASAKATNRSALAEVSDYHIGWVESPCPELGIPLTTGVAVIEGHRRRQTVWALVGKMVERILVRMIDEAEGRR